MCAKFNSFTFFYWSNLNFSHFFVSRYYINYKLMKKKVKQYVQQSQAGGNDRRQVLKEFSRMLDDEVCEQPLCICTGLSLIQHAEYGRISVHTNSSVCVYRGLNNVRWPAMWKAIAHMHWRIIGATFWIWMCICACTCFLLIGHCGRIERALLCLWVGEDL